jgi:hypothetical protein
MSICAVLVWSVEPLTPDICGGIVLAFLWSAQAVVGIGRPNDRRGGGVG